MGANMIAKRFAAISAGLLAIVVGLALSAGLAFAETFTRSCSVDFTADNELVSTFAESGFSEAASEMQPGDTLSLKVDLKNSNKEVTDWYISNVVLKSLEDSSEATGGAYTYELKYNNNVIFSSDTVGGDTDETSDGLEPVKALENYVYLGQIEPDGTGLVTLDITLDGQTQNNTYQDAFAQFQLSFAVELPDEEVIRIPANPNDPDGGTQDDGSDDPNKDDKDDPQGDDPQDDDSDDPDSPADSDDPDDPDKDKTDNGTGDKDNDKSDNKDNGTNKGDGDKADNSGNKGTTSTATALPKTGDDVAQMVQWLLLIAAAAAFIAACASLYSDKKNRRDQS